MLAAQERVDPATFMNAAALDDEEKVRAAWIQSVPHPPEQDLQAALAKAAFPSKDSKGLVLLTSGVWASCFLAAMSRKAL